MTHLKLSALLAALAVTLAVPVQAATAATPAGLCTGASPHSGMSSLQPRRTAYTGRSNAGQAYSGGGIALPLSAPCCQASCTGLLATTRLEPARHHART